MPEINFVHISDIHLATSYGTTITNPLNNMAGTDPTQNFILFLRHIQSKHRNMDFLVVTGDLTNDGQVNDYSVVKNIIEEEIPSLPVYFCMGNHDNRDCFSHVFHGGKDMGRPYYYQEIFGNKLGIVALDSCPGKEGQGMIGEEQIQWLNGILKEKFPFGRILLIHQPPCNYNGDNELKYHIGNVNKLYDCIKDGDILCVLSGHIHQNSLTMLGKIPVATSGSTAFGTEFYKEYMSFTSMLSYNLCSIDKGEFSCRSIPFCPAGYHRLDVSYLDMME